MVEVMASIATAAVALGIPLSIVAFKWKPRRANGNGKYVEVKICDAKMKPVDKAIERIDRNIQTLVTRLLEPGGPK